jgi:hypothetical protein
MRSKSPDQTPYLTYPGSLYLSQNGEVKIVRTLVILVGVKSDESNILQLAIHLFSNRPIYYLLFD